MSEAAQLDLLSWKLHDGATFEPERDGKRIHQQLLDVYEVLKDCQWHTLPEIAAAVGCPQQSASARIRDLRKPKFMGARIDKEYVSKGLWRYILVEKTA